MKKPVVYKTTNLINGNMYIGVNSTNSKYYLGSGELLVKSFKKYGRKNFKKEILFYCDSIEEMFWLEEIIISKWFINKWGHGNPYYNIDVGGKGGGTNLKNYEDVMEQVFQESNGKLLLLNFTRMTDKADVYCYVCDKTFKRRPQHLTGQSKKCPYCNKIARRTHEEYVKELEKVNPNLEVLGKFKRVRFNLKHRCKICNHIWKPSPINVLKGMQCPKCSFNNRCEKQRKNHEDYVLEVKEKRGDQISVLEKYINCDTPINHKCNKSGIVWKASPINILKGMKCKECSKESTIDKIGKKILVKSNAETKSFISISEASRTLGIDRKTLRKYLNKKRKHKIYSFEYSK